MYLRTIITLCLYAYLLIQPVYAQESDDVQVNDAYLDVMSIYAQEPTPTYTQKPRPPAPEPVAKASLEKALQEWVFPNTYE